MKKNDDLFKLIKSLEQPEKGYFKKFAQAHSKSAGQQYLKLFDAIDAQKEYNEALIIKKIKHNSIASQISVAKNYLWELLLKSQRAYRASSSKFMRLNALVENGEILFEKGLYIPALTTWEKAKKLALTFDEKAFVLDIEAWKRRYFVDLRADLWDENVLPSFETTAKLIQQYSTTFEIQKIYFKSTKYIKTNAYFRNPEHKKEWDGIMENPILAIENEPDDFYGKLYFNYVHANYHNLSNNEEKNLYFIVKNLHLWKANPLLIEVEPIRYIAAVNNYLGMLSKFGRYQIFVDYVNAFKPPNFNSISQKAVYFEHWWLWKEITFKIAGDDKAFEVFIKETYSDLLKYAPYINSVRWMLIRFGIAVNYFKLKRFEDALELTNEVIDTKDIELRKDIQAHTRMMYLILHFELKNTLILESISRSLKRYLIQSENYFETERAFIKHFNKLVNAGNKAEVDKIKNDLSDEVNTIFTNNKSEKMAFITMPLSEWLNIKFKPDLT